MKEELIAKFNGKSISTFVIKKKKESEIYKYMCVCTYINVYR